MKKIFCPIFAALLMLTAFSGCGETTEKTVSAGEQMITDAVSDAGEIAQGIKDDVTDAVSDIGNGDSMMDNGEVSDGDGIIGNEDDDNREDRTDAIEEITEDETDAYMSE